MKILKPTILGLIGIWMIYVIHLYIYSSKITFLIPKGYSGPLLIISNQKNGIQINKDNAIYDFTKNNVLKLKSGLLTGFFPLGYLNYYEVDKFGNKSKIDISEDVYEKTQTTGSKLFVWSAYHKVGSCQVSSNNRVSYESIIISSTIDISKYVAAQNNLINQEVCYKRK